VPTGTWLAWSHVNDIAARVAQEWTPAGTALSDGPSAAKVAVGYDRAYTYDGAQRLTNGDRSPIDIRDTSSVSKRRSALGWDGIPGLMLRIVELGSPT
jgi:hypothetical protein